MCKVRNLWHRRLKLQGFPKNHNLIVSRFASCVEWVQNSPLLNEDNNLSFGNDLSEGSIKKNQPRFKSWTTASQNHDWHSYSNTVHNKTSIVRSIKKASGLLLRSLKLTSHSSGQIWGELGHGKLRVNIVRLSLHFHLIGVISTTT